MKNYLIVVLLFFVSFVSFASFAFEDVTKVYSDSVEISLRKEHSPFLASVLSAAVPGAGQIYNKKYWKVPIVLAGISTGVYFFSKNVTDYKLYKDAYIQRQSYESDTSSYIPDQFFGLISDLELLNKVESAHKNYELAIVGTLVFYVLNIVDASVDAHLFNFDVSDDLSMKIEPKFNALGASSFTGISFKVSF